MGELRSQRQRREQLVRSLPAGGKSWVEIAEALRQRYRFNARLPSVTLIAGVSARPLMSRTNAGPMS
jgi:hypothetical protein